MCRAKKFQEGLTVLMQHDPDCYMESIGSAIFIELVAGKGVENPTSVSLLKELGWDKFGSTSWRFKTV